MNNDKFQLSLGFATLVISLSAFKDELSKFYFHIGLIEINMAEYLFYTILALAVSLYFYFAEQIYCQTPPS